MSSASSMQGLRVLLTRSSEGNAEWTPGLNAAGARAVDWPCIRTITLEGREADLRAAFEACDWVAFTSTRALEALRELAPELELSGKRLACVGGVTARHLEASLLEVEVVAREGTARSLGADLLEGAEATQRVLILGALQGRRELPETLRAGGLAFDEVPLYATGSEARHCGDPLPAIDAIFFASPSAVRGFREHWAAPAGVPLISIGPSTSSALVEAGFGPSHEARTRNLEGMLDALARALETPANTPRH